MSTYNINSESELISNLQMKNFTDKKYKIDVEKHVKDYD